MNPVSHWLEKRRRRWTAGIGATLRRLPTPTVPTCCLFCDFEGHFAGGTAAVHAERGTDRLLSLLEKLDLRITFNVVAELCRTHPDRVRRIRDAGHEIACHGFRHERPRDLRHDSIDAMLREAAACFAELGVRPVGFRSPESAWCVQLLPALQRHGYVWNAERDPSPGAYRIRRDLIRLPVRTDDWDLSDGNGSSGGHNSIAMLLDKWSSHADAAATQSRLLLVGGHEWIFGLRDGFDDAMSTWAAQRRHDGWQFRTMGDVAETLTRAR